LHWTLPGEEAVKKYNKGDTIKVKILDVDVDKERISLGIKQLAEDPFDSSMKDIKRGSVVTCTVHKILDSGIEVRVGDGVIGFIRKTDLSRERSEQRPDRFAIGEKVDAKVTTVDAKSRKISLSIKAREVEEEKKAMKDYGSAESGASLGDILGAAISKAVRKKEETTESAEEEPKAETTKAKDEAPKKKAAKKTTAKKTAKKKTADKKTTAKKKAAKAESDAGAESGEAKDEAG
ncbi:MAG: S1 RNA-binding domain-containing protein, partial [Kiloniellales bacterium]